MVNITRGITTIGGGKGVIVVESNGSKTLYSYDTRIMNIDPQGQAIRFYNGWTTTTGRHIKEFCGMNKAEFMELTKH